MNVLGFIVAVYFSLLGVSIGAVLLDEFMWFCSRWFQPSEDEEIEEVISQIKNHLDEDTFNVINLITLSSLKENVSNLLASIAILLNWHWYSDTTDYIGAVHFVQTFDERLVGLSSRDVSAMHRFKESQVKRIDTFRQEYPRTFKFLRCLQI
jgi:hypothetical protein